MQKVTAGTLGFVAASIVPAITFVAYSIVVKGKTSAYATLVYFTGVFYYALLAALLLAVPPFLLFYWLNLVRWWTALCVGMCAGAFMGFVISPQTTLASVAGMSLVGAISGMCFWLIWRRGR